ncbi:MAG TPA: HAMP domain-containing protein [Alphaproteobacteria bacterium]|nr:HAMP domain-containing protein [Alphaproteobacteria bacterium]
MDRLSSGWTNPENVKAWNELKTIRDEFSAAQDRVEAIYDPADTGPAIAMLLREAAPRAEKILEILMGPPSADGTRAGGMVDNQVVMLEADNQAVANGTSILLATQWVLLALGIVAGAAISLFTGRAISAPLVKMTRVMTQLANGDFECEVPGKDRGDEIGDMAAAVQVFKENGIKVAAMSQDERQRARLVAERAEMMQRFQSAFDAVIEATVEGDFSKRIDGRFDDADIDRISTNFNAMLETVNAALSEAGHVLAGLANADLTQRMEGSYRGVFATLRDDTNAVADKLTEIVGQLRNTSRALKAATSEILAGANDLAERTTKQAAAIEETSAAMEQLSATVADNARKSEEASVRTESAASLADEGGQVMNQATAAMDRITASSARISNIIGMIDDIAFQTNLLALNASVEAARAGEAGKGFAVVAVEVRRLAQSAAQASAEVKQLIEQSTQEVSGGTKLVANAASKLEAILQAVQENRHLMRAISEASREQSSAIGEVTAAIRQMDEMTQHNAALVEETNAAIEQTEAQATDLDRIVDIFRVERGTRYKLAAPAEAPPRQGGIRGLKDKVKSAAISYLNNGSAAIKQDWNEF